MTTNTWQPPVLTEIPRAIGEAMMKKTNLVIANDEIKQWLDTNGYKYYNIGSKGHIAFIHNTYKSRTFNNIHP